MQVPGCLYIKRERYYYKVTFEGDIKPTVTALKPPGKNRATKDVDVAEELARAFYLKHNPDADGFDGTIESMAKLFLVFADKFYRDGNGVVSREPESLRASLVLLREKFGDFPADSFGPKKLKELRGRMMDSGTYCRREINRRIGHVKRLWKWGESEEYVAGGSYHALLTVTGLKRGREGVFDHDERQPIAHQAVEVTRKYCTQVLNDMIGLHELTGMRPTELCIMRPCDIKIMDELWLYEPMYHKTKYLGKDRHIYLGPNAQNILRSYMLRTPFEFCFSPTESERQRRQTQRLNRKTPLSCGNKPGTNIKKDPKRKPSLRYNDKSYQRAVKYAIVKAQKDGQEIPHWTPYQLRHSLATKLDKEYDLETAAAVLGNDVEVAKIYAKRDENLAKSAALKFG